LACHLCVRKQKKVTKNRGKSRKTFKFIINKRVLTGKLGICKKFGRSEKMSVFLKKPNKNKTMAKKIVIDKKVVPLSKRRNMVNKIMKHMYLITGTLNSNGTPFFDLLKNRRGYTF